MNKLWHQVVSVCTRFWVPGRVHWWQDIGGQHPNILKPWSKRTPVDSRPECSWNGQISSLEDFHTGKTPIWIHQRTSSHLPCHLLWMYRIHSNHCTSGVLNCKSTRGWGYYLPQSMQTGMQCEEYNLDNGSVNDLWSVWNALRNKCVLVCHRSCTPTHPPFFTLWDNWSCCLGLKLLIITTHHHSIRLVCPICSTQLRTTPFPQLWVSSVSQKMGLWMKRYALKIPGLKRLPSIFNMLLYLGPHLHMMYMYIES